MLTFLSGEEKLTNLSRGGEVSFFVSEVMVENEGRTGSPIPVIPS